MKKATSKPIKVKIDTESSRKTLAREHPRKDPYWYKLGKGYSIGYRKSLDTGRETWHMRYRPDQQYHYLVLGDVSPSMQWPEALKAAAEAKDLIDNPPVVDPVEEAQAASEEYWAQATVGDLVDEYIAKHRDRRSSDWHNLSVRFANAYVHTRRIGDVPLLAMTSDDFIEHQLELAESGLAPETINRAQAAPLRAALNWALKNDILTKNVWSRVPYLEEVEKVDKKRNKKYFDKAERLRFATEAPQPLRDFLLFLYYTGCRPSEARRLQVKHIDLFKRKVMLTTLKGHGGKRRTREFSLHGYDDLVGLLARLVDRKSGDEPVFRTAKGVAWEENNLCIRVRKYRKATEAHPDWETYCFRHGLITDLVDASLPVARIAQAMGTSVKHIEENYLADDPEMGSLIAAVTEVA